MKRNFILAAIAGLVFASAAFAQKAPDFSGTWTLDVSKSKLGDRNNIESETLTVTQSATELKVDTQTKRTAPPQGGGGGGFGGGRGGFGGGGMGGPQTYTLDGKEVKTDREGPNGSSISISTKAKIDGSKLTISRSTSFGERTSSSKDVWELSSDGKTLTVNSERETPQGSVSTTKVYTKS